VYDENGNQITRFGEYGNMDSQGPDSSIPCPEIPINYAFRIAVSNKALYINDSGSQRVLKVWLDYEDNACIDMSGNSVKWTSPSVK
jgi:hypothetical protein